MTRLILHLGDHKTGTSTLQRLFAAGGAPAHVLYPQAGRANGAGHHNLAWEIGATPRFNPAKGSWQDVAHEIAGQAPDIALISTEAMEFKRPHKVLTTVREALAPAISQIDGVIYLRPHASRLMSSFAERVKRGIGPFDRETFLDQALNSRRFQFAPRIAQWRNALLPGTLDVRIFERSHLENGDVVEDFFRTVFAAPPPAARAELANKTPSENSLLIMQMQGAAFAAYGGQKFARSKAGAIQAAAEPYDKGAKPRWAHDEAERIKAACMDDAEALDSMLDSSVFVSALDDALTFAAEPPILSAPMSDAMTEIITATAHETHRY